MSKRSYYINIDLPAPNEDNANFTSFRVDFVPGTSLPEVEKAYSEIGQWLAAMAHISEGTNATVKAPIDSPADAPVPGEGPDLTLVEPTKVEDPAPVATEEKKKKKRRSSAQMKAARKAAANGVDPEPATPEDPFNDDQKPATTGHHGPAPSVPDLIAAARDWLGGDGSTEALQKLLAGHQTESGDQVERLRDIQENERAGVMAKFMETA